MVVAAAIALLVLPQFRTRARTAELNPEQPAEVLVGD
jgi:hypothetical protein